MAREKRWSAPTPSVRKGLDPDVLVGAARRIARRGLSELTMAALAEELGVTPMAAYRHVRNKEHLVSLLLDSVSSEVVVPPKSVGDWTTRLRIFHRDVTNALLRYPGLVFVPHLPTASSHRLLEGYLSILIDAGFSEGEAAQAYTGLYYLAMGTVTDAERTEAVSPAAYAPDPHEDLPATARVAPMAARISRADYHDFALDAYLSGLTALIKAKHAAGRSRSKERPRSPTSS